MRHTSCLRSTNIVLSLLFSVLLALAPALSFACDIYANNLLTIPTVYVGQTTYTNVVVTVGTILGVGAVTANPSAATLPDVYNPATGQLTIPCVTAYGGTYTNIVVSIASIVSYSASNVAPAKPFLIPTFPMPEVTVGVAYSASAVFSVVPAATYTFGIDSLANGVVPTGMSINLNGLLSGTAFATGAADVNGRQVDHSYTFGICATDTLSHVATSPCPQTTITVHPTRIAVTLAGTGAGNVTPSSNGNDCGDNCWSGYASGASVTLTATSGSGSVFTGWSGACTGTGNCTVTTNGKVEVTATFNAVDANAATIAYTSATCSAGDKNSFNNDNFSYTATVAGPVNSYAYDWSPLAFSVSSYTCGAWTDTGIYGIGCKRTSAAQPASTTLKVQGTTFTGTWVLSTYVSSPSHAISRSVSCP